MDEANELLERYKNIYESQALELSRWAVHKIGKNNSHETIIPTIPFVGKKYFEQDKKILVYASAENLSNHYYGLKTDRPWLDDDNISKDRHRYCFDNKEMQRGRKLPYVHCAPMEDGGLLVAIMYLVSKIRGGFTEEPYEFYETIAFGNYGKFTIETELQNALRNNPMLTDKERAELKKSKHLKRCNIDYASKPEYLKLSGEYVKADIEILKPDYIIMPRMKNDVFTDKCENVIRIHQINGCVINNIAPNKRNNYCSKYTQRDVCELPLNIKNACENIRGINLENYRYIFDYLDKISEEHDL